MNVLIAVLTLLGRLVFLVTIGPLLLIGTLLTLCLSDLVPRGRRKGGADKEVRSDAISVVIPN